MSTVINQEKCELCETCKTTPSIARRDEYGLCSCVCGQISVSESFYYESGITADEYKEYLLNSLNAGPDACTLPDNFMNMLDQYWEIYKNLACGSNDLRYLYVRAAAITALMGCAIFDVTTRISTGESNSRSETIGKSDAETQGQSTSHNASYNESVFESAYSDFANSLLRASSQRSAQSDSHDQSRTITDDVGYGMSESVTEGERDSSSDRTSRDRSESSMRGSSTGARRGSDYSFTHSTSDSNQGGGDVKVFFGFVGGVTRRASKGANIRLMTTDSYNSSSSDRTGTSSKTLRAESWSQSWSRRLSSSFFQAVLDSNTNARSNAVAFDYSSSQSDAEAHSAGKGQSAAESEARSTSSSQRTSESTSLATSETDGSSDAYSIAEYRANSQKFDHLAVLLENTNNAIQEYLSHRGATIGIGIAKIITARPDGYCNLDAIRSRLRYPGGVNGILCYPQKPRMVNYAQ